MIRKDKLRNSKSMIELKGFFKNKKTHFKNSSSLDDEITEEQKEFLEAHHLNRRKSCICLCCGGDDNTHIKQMDKNAMDMIK